MRAYNSIDFAQPWILRGTHQQTDVGLLHANPTYKLQPVGGGAQITRRIPGLALQSFALHNRSGGALVAGIGVRIPNDLWIAGQYVDATTTFTDDTPAAQDTTTNDFPLETLTNNDGYIIASRVPFNAVSINVSTASVDGVAVARAARFSDSVGTAWQTAESNIFQQTGSATNYATGEAVVVFAPPVDWGKSSALATGLPNGYYAMNVRATDAPVTTAGLAKAIEIFRIYYLTEAVADNAVLDKDFGGSEMKMAQDAVEGWYGDALVALFGTANDMNRVTANVRSL